MSSKPKSNVTKEVAKPTLVPKLRFPEFREAEGWAPLPLLIIADPVVERATQGAMDDVLSLSAEHGIVLQSEYFGKKVAGDRSERYVKVVRDDFVYNDRTTKASIFGTIKRLSKYPGGIVSPIYKCFRLHAGENPVFWEYYFESGKQDVALRLLVNEGARSGRFNISISQFLSTDVCRPDKAEQQKIASCLSSLDSLITAHTQKLNALRTHKKGLMQKLFPSEGETVPRLRFPEFRDTEGWKEKNGNALFDQVNDRNPLPGLPILAITQEHGAIPRDQIDYHVFVTEKSVESYKVVHEGDFIISLRSFQGGIEYSKYHGICSPAYVILRRRAEGDNEYFKHYLKTDSFIRILTRNLEGLRDGKMVSYSQFSELLIPAPKPDEQRRIASCVSSLDLLITAQTQKLNALRTHKKGLMQQLFPALEEKVA